MEGTKVKTKVIPQVKMTIKKQYKYLDYEKNLPIYNFFRFLKIIRIITPKAIVQKTTELSFFTNNSNCRFLYGKLHFVTSNSINVCFLMTPKADINMHTGIPQHH
jgi:hypothetical protein